MQSNALGDVGLASLAGAFSSDLTRCAFKGPLATGYLLHAPIIVFNLFTTQTTPPFVSLQLGPGPTTGAPPPLLALSRLTLHTLDLSGNGIGDLGADTLCRWALVLA